MAKVSCPGCSANIPDDARTCEQCGARPIRVPAPLMTLAPILHGVAVSAVLLAVLGSIGLFLFGVVLTP